MEVNPFLKRMMKVDNSDIFHSSAYGSAQSGSGMGATSSRSFSDRMKVENSRRVVKGYGSSSIANSAIGNGPRAKVCAPSSNGGVGGGIGGGARPNPLPPRNPGISR